MPFVNTTPRFILGGTLLIGGAVVLVGQREGVRLATAGAASRPVADATASELTLSAPFRVTLPPAVAARAMAGFDAAQLGSDAALHPSTAPLQLAFETFESTVFPPAGWSRVDNQAASSGGADQFVWSRETCDVEPIRGGQAAAWAVGGGERGQLLACAGHYSAPVDSWLVYGPIDTRGFADGLRVNLRLRLDQPRPEGGSLHLCATTGPAVNDIRCRAIDTQKSGWTTFAESVVLPWAAGHSQALFALRYLDPSPTGQVFGAMVDNILLEGAGGGIVPTPTQTPRAQATATPSSTPSPTRPAGPTTLTFSCTSCPRPLPQTGRFDFQFVVAPGTCGGPVEDVNVSVNVWHPWRWDVIARIHAPGTNWLQLFSHLDWDSNNVGSNRQDLTLDDEAAIAVNEGDCQTKGDDRCIGSYYSYSEEERQPRMLRRLYGARAEGTWGIQFADDFRQDTGTIMDWSVSIRCAAAPVIPTPTRSATPTAPWTATATATRTPAGPTATPRRAGPTPTPVAQDAPSLFFPAVGQSIEGHWAEMLRPSAPVPGDAVQP